MSWDRLKAKANWGDGHRLMFDKDCRSMADLPDEAVQMIVTSPPYWGLRKYSGLPDLIWGGNGSCEHTEMTSGSVRHDNLRFRGEHSIVGNEKNKEIHPVHSWGENTFAIQGNNSMVRGKDETDSGAFAIPKFKDTDMRQTKVVAGQFCSLCGAWKGQLGLEPTPELYISHLVEIFREVRRVLRKDGVVFLNIGDSYMSHAGDRSKVGGFQANPNPDRLEAESSMAMKKQTTNALKDKDLCLIPFRLAIALQDDGWWVRSVIIWNKPNPMPESVTDRPSESHEYILMLTKSSHYYWDAEAVREPQKLISIARAQRKHDTPYNPGYPGGIQNHISEYYKRTEGESIDEITEMLGGRNLRSVWTFPTQPYPEAHFATYPEKLVEICVKAATPEVGCCSKCGKPWVRIINIPYDDKHPTFNEWRRLNGIDIATAGKIKFDPRQTETSPQGYGSEISRYYKEVWGQMSSPKQTLGWKPQCSCNADKVPSIVLDPFAGSGTTLKVAAELNRRAIGYELSDLYCKLAVERNKQLVMSSL